MTDNNPVFQNSILFCQKALRREVERITEDMMFQDAGGKGLVKLKVYDQKLPVPRGKVREMEDAEESIDFIGDQVENAIVQCPWCKVVANNGRVKEAAERQQVQLCVILGIFNDGERNSGYEETVNIIQRFLNRFSENPFLEEQFEQVGEMDWEVNDDQDTFPYTFGAITVTFEIKGMRRTWGEEFL